MNGSYWQKDSLITHIRFELQPILVANFGDQSLLASSSLRWLIGHSSTVFRDHPDWLVKQKRNGTSNIFHFNPNWHDDSYTYAVDLTHPGVQKWLKNVFVELKSYGFDYFKLDYLIAGIRDGIRYENNISSVEAYRIGMQIIRDAVGKDSFILPLHYCNK